MYGSELSAFSFWWIVPVVMMILCFFMMRRCKGTMMSGFGCCGRNWQQTSDTPSAKDILDRRYASGEIDQTEYKTKKKVLTDTVEPNTD